VGKLLHPLERNLHLKDRNFVRMLDILQPALAGDVRRVDEKDPINDA
jgi:hypothetical protein